MKPTSGWVRFEGMWVWASVFEGEPGTYWVHLYSGNREDAVFLKAETGVADASFDGTGSDLRRDPYERERDRAEAMGAIYKWVRDLANVWAIHGYGLTVGEIVWIRRRDGSTSKYEVIRIADDELGRRWGYVKKSD